MPQNLEALKASCSEAVAKKELAADPMPGLEGHWITKCNFGLQFIGGRMGCQDFKNLTATAIIKKISTMPTWLQVPFGTGADKAMTGSLCFLGWVNPDKDGHGHVAVVAPEPMQYSGTWGINVPMVANIGKPPNGIMKASGAFLLAMKNDLKCFVWLG